MADIKTTWENFKGLELITDEFQYSVAKRLITNELGDISNGYMLSHAEERAKLALKISQKMDY